VYCPKRKARRRLAPRLTEEQIIAVLREQMSERIRLIWRANIEAATDGGCAADRLSAGGSRACSRPGELELVEAARAKGERRVTGCMQCMSNMRACPIYPPEF
jgi:hypothetical protein